MKSNLPPLGKKWKVGIFELAHGLSLPSQCWLESWAGTVARSGSPAHHPHYALCYFSLMWHTYLHHKVRTNDTACTHIGHILFADVVEDDSWHDRHGYCSVRLSENLLHRVVLIRDTHQEWGGKEGGENKHDTWKHFFTQLSSLYACVDKGHPTTISEGARATATAIHCVAMHAINEPDNIIRCPKMCCIVYQCRCSKVSSPVYQLKTQRLLVWSCKKESLQCSSSPSKIVLNPLKESFSQSNIFSTSVFLCQSHTTPLYFSQCFPPNLTLPRTSQHYPTPFPSLFIQQGLVSFDGVFAWRSALPWNLELQKA